MIRASAGAELCASHNNPLPKPTDCVKAVDHTYQGDIDLSGRVVVGDPVQKSPLEWSVPYNVKDDAGNEATTVWRDIVVEEVDLVSIETKIRNDVMSEQQAETDKAVQKAIREEKLKWEKDYAAQQASSTSTNSRSNRRTSGNKNTCPACPPCDCPEQQGNSVVGRVDGESCQAYCENVSRSCTLSDGSIMYAALFWLEDMLPPSIAPIVMVVMVLFGLTYVLRTLTGFIFNPRPYQSYDYSDYGPNHDGSLLRNRVEEARQPPPRAPLPKDGSPAFFSPSERRPLQSPPPSNTLLNNGNRTPATPASASRRDREIYDESIYATPLVITPSRNGDGVRRRNPYT